MSLKEIIIVDEENTKFTIQASPTNYNVKKIENGKYCIEMGTSAPLDLILTRFIREEWTKIKNLGARLATRKN